MNLVRWYSLAHVKIRLNHIDKGCPEFFVKEVLVIVPDFVGSKGEFLRFDQSGVESYSFGVVGNAFDWVIFVTRIVGFLYVCWQ